MDDHPEEKVREGLRKVLNSHGYGFHYAVLRKANELRAKEKSQWYFEAAEYPVSVGGFDTRIDFILRSQDAQATYWDCFLISECKRVDPALSNWVFVRTPHDSERVILEKLLFSDPNFPTATGEPVFSEIKNTYNIGLEVSSGRKGDSSGRGRGQIEEAATQVCKHLNGIVEEFKRREDFLKKAQSVHFLPVIFTTAQIWTSEVDIGGADLQTGDFELKDIDAKRKNRIWLQYHLSPGIKHSVRSQKSPKGLREALAEDYIRTIAVVTATGIEEFLGVEWWVYI